jgi:hypothetical protein
MSMQILITVLAVAAILVIAYWRISGGRYGKLRPSREATVAYESFQIDSGRDYYSSGPDFCPNAIMGMDKSRSLESDLWKKKDLTAEGMKRLVEHMRARAMEKGASLHGFDILNEKGGKIGDWFSIPGLNIMIRTEGENRVVVSTPPLDIYPMR